MKTKIKSLIIICALGLVGAVNANATLSYKTSSIDGKFKEAKTENSENLYSSGFALNGASGFDYQKEAQLVTRLIADNEEAKTIQMLIDRGIFVSNDEPVSFAGEARSENLNSTEFVFNADAEIDYQKEAQLITKWNADNQEARVVQRLIDEGKLAQNK